MANFFFQAEDGIRDGRVTGVQTCALPISTLQALEITLRNSLHLAISKHFRDVMWFDRQPSLLHQLELDKVAEIGRASCRERVEILVIAEVLDKKTIEQTHQDNSGLDEQVQ